MSVRVTVICEGSGESRGDLSERPSPGDVLTEEYLGSAHLLVRRGITHSIPNLDVRSIVFVEPLRTGRGRRPVGSQLLDRSTVIALHKWTNSEWRPQLSIMLIDNDEVVDRRSRISSYLPSISDPTPILAVAVQEFEAWLIADQTAINSLTKRSIQQTPDPEGLRAGAAKAILNEWLEGLPDAAATRREIARTCQLDVLSRRCRSFSQFLSDLRAAQTSIGARS